MRETDPPEKDPEGWRRGVLEKREVTKGKRRFDPMSPILSRLFWGKCTL